MSERAVRAIAEGDVPTGEHWVLRAGGTREDFDTSLETIYPDGRHDEGGMAGPPLHRDSLINIYSGGTDRGLRRFLVRADPRVARIELRLTGGERLELAQVATWTGPDLTFFATLLRQEVGLVSVVAVSLDGRGLDAGDLSLHEASWRRFRARRPPTP